MKNRLMKFLGSLVLVAALPCFAGSVKDSRDGQKYKTVKIGNQEWMAQNLNYKTNNSWCYEDKPINCQKYGRLYNWNAAQKACPAGWHLPSEKEFSDLINLTGGEKVAGKNLKSKNDWDDEGNGKDAFGFAALPAGRRDDKDSSGYMSEAAVFWSSTKSDFFEVANMLKLSSERKIANLSLGSRTFGFSVRCLKNH